MRGLCWSVTNMLSISATELPRFLKCGGSASLDCKTPPRIKESKVRDEGNAAHWLVEQVIKHGMSPDELIDRAAPNGIYITGEMIEHLTDYINECKKNEALIEYSLNFEIAGIIIKCRMDSVQSLNEYNHVVNDLKYGYRIVEPDTWTMTAYGLALLTNAWKINTVALRIYQPRPYHKDGKIRHVLLSKQELEEAYISLRTLIEKALQDNNLNTGDHCHYCKKAHVCPAARQAGFNAIDASTQAFVDDLPDNELSLTMDEVNTAIDRLNDLKSAYDDEAFARIKQGRVIPNYFAEYTNSQLKWNDTVSTGFLEMMGATKTVSLTPLQAEKKGIDIKPFSHRKNSSLKLIRQDANKRASNIFKQGVK